MHGYVRHALAVLAGVMVSGALVYVSDLSVRNLYPLPGPAEMRDPEVARAALAAVPTVALMLLVMGWALAGSVGAFVAARLALGPRRVAGLVVTGVLMLATAANLAMVPHPVWMWPASLVLIGLLGWVGARAGAERPAPDRTT
jgi:hypothetical protein